VRWPTGYTEWPAPAALRATVACLWAQVTPDGADRHGLVLPDGCSDLIWEPGTGAYLAGPDTGPMPTEMPAGTVILGARFRPAAGGPALGLPLHHLRDQRVGLCEVRPAEARRLPGSLEPAQAAARLLAVTAALVTSSTPDYVVTQVARRLRDPRARTDAVAADAGLSERQLRRRCQDAIGYGPKTLQRVLRFRRFISRIDAGAGQPPAPLDLAGLAAEAGYADQAHLTRECGQFAGLTPLGLIRQRVPDLLRVT
jgi:AraC-like DNA-binding protein